MARTPVGIRPQPETDTALFAHIAHRLDPEATTDIASYAAGELQIKAGSNAIRKAPATAARLALLANPRAAIQPWLRLDLEALDFFSALVRVEPLSAESRAALARETGVLELFSFEASTELVLLVTYERRSDQRNLRSRLGEHGRVLVWEVLEEHAYDPAVHTWRSLTRAAAAREGLAVNRV